MTLTEQFEAAYLSRVCINREVMARLDEVRRNPSWWKPERTPLRERLSELGSK